MTTLKFYESLKAIFYEVEVFVNSTLDGVQLNRQATIEKESILRKLRELQNEYPQLRTAASLPDTPKSPLNKEPAEKPNVKGPSVTSSVKEEQEEEQEDGEIYADVEPVAPDSARSSHLTTTPSAASVSSSKKSTAASVSGESEDSQSICSSPVMTALEISSESPMTGYLVRKNLGKLDIKSMMQGLKATFLGKMYCVAYRGVFYLYDKMNSKRPTDNIILHGYEVRPSSAEQTSKKEFSFELVCPGKKSYGFAAGSEEEMKKWVDVLNEESLKEPEIQAYTSKSKSSLASLTSPGSTNDDDTDDDEDYEDADGIAPPVPQQSGKKLQQHQQLKSDKSSRSDKALPPQPGRQDKAPLPQPSRSDKPLPQTPGNQSDDDSEIYADIGPTEATKPSIKVQPVQEDNSVTLQDDFYDDAECAANRSAVGKESSQSTKNTNNDDDDDDDYDNKYYGKWDCSAESENEISFYCGDMVKVLSREYDKFGWWVAKAHGIIGLVPRDYLTPAYQLVS